MTGPKPNANPAAASRRFRATMTATVATVGLLVACGASYRRLATYLARPPEGASLTSEQLRRLPLQIGRWSGRDVPLDEAIVDATDTDAHVNRMYRRADGSVGLYVAYGIRARDLAPHRPEVCYPGSGWTLQAADPVQLTDVEGVDLPCKVYRFTGGGDLAVKAVTVLNYYIIDGRISSDVSALRSNAWRGGSGVRYLAQVQITCTEEGVSSTAAADQLTAAFASEAAPRILALFAEGPEG